MHNAVGVRVAAAREPGDVLAPLEPQLVGGLAQRAPEALGVGVEARQLVEAHERVEHVGRPAVGAVGRPLVGGVGEDEMLSLRVGALDRLGHRGRRLQRLGGARRRASGRAGRLAQRRAQMRDRLGVLRGRLAQLLDLAQELLAVGADGVELVQQRLVRREPLVGGLAARPDGRLGLLASLGQMRLGGRGPRLGALELLGEALGAGASSVRSASAASRRRLAVSTWRRRSSTRARSRSACCWRAATDLRSSSASRTRASSGDAGISACWRNFSHEP